VRTLDRGEGNWGVPVFVVSRILKSAGYTSKEFRVYYDCRSQIFMIPFVWIPKLDR